MRWCAVALSIAAVVSAGACNAGSTSSPSAIGQLAFQKDSISCADTTNTELFIDAVSQGQFVMRPGSIVGFTKSAGTHLASAKELAGALRQFSSQAIAVPANGTGTYLLQCATTQPPASRSPSP